MVGIPDLDNTILVSAQANLEVPGRSRASQFQFLVSLQHEFDRPAGRFGNPRRRDAPIIRGKFTAEPAADVFALDMDIVGGQSSGRPGELFVSAGDVLRR